MVFLFYNKNASFYDWEVFFVLLQVCGFCTTHYQFLMWEKYLRRVKVVISIEWFLDPFEIENKNIHPLNNFSLSLHFSRKNHTNAQCVQNHFQLQAISNLTHMCTLEPGHSSVTSAIEGLVNKQTWKTIFYCIQVSN